MENKIYADAKRIISQLVEESINDKEIIIPVVPETALSHRSLVVHYYVRFRDTVDFLISEEVFELIEEYGPQTYPFHAGSFKIKFHLNKGKELLLKYKENILRCGKLFLDLERSEAGYDSKIITVDLETNPIKLLHLLMSNKGKHLDYKRLAAVFGEEYSDNLNNADVEKRIQTIRRDLVTFLKKDLGMSENQIRSMIVGKGGYRLDCPS